MFNKTFLLTGIVYAHYHPSPHDYCERLCHENRECREDPHAHGSYCKLDHHPHTCFGLYYKKHHHHHDHKDGRVNGVNEDSEDDEEHGYHHHHHHKKTCFQPNDRHCDDSKLKPVLCGHYRPRD